MSKGVAVVREEPAYHNEYGVFSSNLFDWESKIHCAADVVLEDGHCTSDLFCCRPLTSRNSEFGTLFFFSSQKEKKETGFRGTLLSSCSP